MWTFGILHYGKIIKNLTLLNVIISFFPKTSRKYPYKMSVCNK